MAKGKSRNQRSQSRQSQTPPMGNSDLKQPTKNGEYNQRNLNSTKNKGFKFKHKYSHAWTCVAFLAPLCLNLILHVVNVSVFDLLSTIANIVTGLAFLGIGVTSKKLRSALFPPAFYVSLVCGFIASCIFFANFTITPVLTQPPLDTLPPTEQADDLAPAVPIPSQTPTATPEPSNKVELSIPDITYPTSGDQNIPDFIPDSLPESLVQMISETLSFLIPPTPSNKGNTDFSPALFDAVKAMVATDIQPNRDEVNGSSQFVMLTTRANELENPKDSDANHMNRAKCEEMTSLREEAYRLFPIKDLRIILSENYHLLARFSRNEGDYQQAFDEYSTAIKYCLLYIKILPTTDSEDFFRAIFKLGILYQCIGDIPGIDSEFQEQAYSLSSGFLELAMNHWINTEKIEKAFESTYYCAMANHKLLIVMWSNNKKECSQYVINAYAFYNTALQLAGTDRAYINRALAEICNYGQLYTERFQRLDGMLAWSEYKQAKESYINPTKGRS